VIICDTQHYGIICDTQLNDTQHNNSLPSCWMSLCWVSHFIYCYAECRYAEYHYVECHILSIVMLNVVTLNVIMSLCWVSLWWMPLYWVSLRWMSQLVSCTATQYLHSKPQSRDSFSIPLLYQLNSCCRPKDSIFCNIKFWNDFLFCFCHLLFLNGCFITLSGQNLFNWDTRSILDQFKVFSMANT
jgi:hypothetical protein